MEQKALFFIINVIIQGQLFAYTNIFGGYASIPWTCTGNGKSAPDSFIFTLTNIYNTEPIKCPNSDISQSITHNQNYGPTFHNDIFVENDFLSQDSYSSFPSKYQDILGKGKSIFTGDINNNNNYFKIREIEVFKLFKQLSLKLNKI